MNNNETGFSWNSKIGSSETVQKSILLPEGDYPFKIIGFEKGYFNGSAKVPACAKATLTLRVTHDEGTVDIKKYLFLHPMFEKMLIAFFRSIGRMHKGEEYTMDWSNIIGADGVAHIEPASYEKNGNTYQKNDVKYFVIKDNDLPESTSVDDDF